MQTIENIPTGNKLEFVYSTGLLTIKEWVGTNYREITGTLSSSQLTSVTLPDPDGVEALTSPVWSYAYSGTSGLLTKVTDPVGSTSEFTYGSGTTNETVVAIKQSADTSDLTPFTSNGTGRRSPDVGMLKAVGASFGLFYDEQDKLTQFRANEVGFVIEVKDHNSNSTKFDRNTEGFVTKITTPDPDGLGNLLASETTYTYDALGNILTETKRAAGATAILAQQRWEYPNPNEYSLPNKHIDELGRVTKYTFGAKADVASKRGKILAMTEIVGLEDGSTVAETDDATTNYTYTTVAGHVGLLDTATDALGRVTKFEYWTTDPHEGLVKKVTSNYGATPITNVQYEYDNFLNRKTVIDELGRRTETEFDKLDRGIKRTDPDPDGTTGTQYTWPITHFAYDAASNLIKTTDPLNNVTRSIYDQRNRLIYEIAPRPDNTTAYTRTIDDEDTGFTMTAGWNDYAYAPAYNGDYRWHSAAAGSPNYALWEFGDGNLNTPGDDLDPTKNYEIFITWPVFTPGNATDAPHEVLDVSNNVLKTVALDENYAPNDETVGGVGWERLGVFTGSIQYKVKVKPSSTGWVGADAVRIVEVGPTVKYEYDPAGNLQKSTDELGNTTTYGYDDLHRLISTTLPDPDGSTGPLTAPVYQTQYYNHGLVKKEIDALGNETVYEPDALGRTVKITAPDPDGATTTYTSPITKYQYDAAGQMTYVTQTDVAATLTRTTQYFYDGLGRQNAVALPVLAGTPAESKQNNQTTPPTNWTRDTSSGYLGDHLHRDAGSASEYAEWSFSGLDTSKTYAVYATWVVKNDVNNLPLNASNARYELREGTNAVGKFFVNQKYAPADEITDTNINWSRLGLYKPTSTSMTVRLYADADGKLVADGLRLVEVGPVSKTAYNKVGNLTKTVDPLGQETLSLYDGLDRLTTVYESLRDPTQTPYRPTPVDNPNNSDWTLVSDARAYDGDYLKANASSSTYATYSLTVPSKSYYPTLAVMATWTPSPDNIDNALFRIYDEFNNNIAWLYVDQTIAPGDYQDETGRWWQVLHVQQMIPFSTTIYVSPQPGAQADAVRLIEVGPTAFKNTYDAAGNLTQVTDAKNNDTWFYFDDLNRVKEEKNELLESRYFEYDANSRLTKETDRNARVIEHYYDNLGRQTEERWKSGASTVRSMTFGYNANGQMTSADDDGAKGRDYDWLYDKMGRVEEIRWDGFDFISIYHYQLKNSYDANSQRWARIFHIDPDDPYTSADVVTDYWWYDNLGRATAQQQYDNLAVHRKATYSYNAVGQLTAMDRSNYTTGWNLLVNTTWDYDNAGRIEELKHFKADRSTLLAGYTYGWDAAGRMTAMDFSSAVRDATTVNAEDVATFGYDRTGQLLTGERTGTTNDEAYAYDSAGNRTSANGATYTTTANNRLTDDGTFTYTYDDEGNVLTKVRKSGAAADDKTVEYTWDYRNRLEKVTFKRNDGTVTKTVEYYYDMFNRLTRRDIDADGAGPGIKLAEQFMHDGQEAILHSIPDSGSWRAFMRGPEQDMVLFEARDALRVFLGDHLNTIRDVVDTLGNIVNHLTIDSFGRRTAETNGNIEVMIGLSGRLYDEDTRLQNHVNRWYSVDTGRWISEDPIGFGGGDANLSRFVGNSPTNSIDSFGTLEVGRKPLKAFVARQLAKIPQSEFVLVTDEGTRYTGSTSAELYDAIQQVAKDKETVDALVIKSHGNDEGMWDDDGDVFPSADPDRGKVWLVDEKGRMRDVLPDLQAITDTDSSICLRGCESDVQAEHLYDLIGNGTEVKGNTTVSSGIPGTVLDIPYGPTVTFTDGQEEPRRPTHPGRGPGPQRFPFHPRRPWR